MAKINGTNLTVSADFGDGKGIIPIGFAENCKISVDHSPAKATTKDSNGWEEAIGGLKKWTIDGSGMSDFHPSATSHNVADLFTILNNRTLITVNFSLSSPGSGDQSWKGTAFITKLEMDAKLETAVTYSYAFEGTGPIAMQAS